jgi:hypothetical protein
MKSMQLSALQNLHAFGVGFKRKSEELEGKVKGYFVR